MEHTIRLADEQGAGLDGACLRQRRGPVRTALSQTIERADACWVQVAMHLGLQLSMHLSFFLPGFTGLAISIGAIVTLFVVMQMTARIDWFSQQGAEA